MTKQYDNDLSGALFAVAEADKKSEHSPDFRGECELGGINYWIAGWKNKSKAGVKYLSLKFTVKEDESAPKPTPKGKERIKPGIEDDDIAF